VVSPDDATLPPQVSPPEFALSALTPLALRGVTALAYPVLPADDTVGTGLLVSPAADELAAAAGLDLWDVLAAAGATGAAGEVFAFPVARDGALLTVYLVGVGAQDTQDLRRAGAALARAARDRDSLATSIAADAPAGGLEAFVVGLMLGSFEFHWRSEGPKHRPVARVVLAGLADAEERSTELLRAIALGGATWRARALATVPSNLKNPEWLAAQARRVAEAAGLDVTIWGEAELEARGMGGLLAVGQASETPPRLIRLDYSPAGAGRRTPTVVLVGKGVTFDTGGLSIKPADAMTTMKRDMTGGAVVIAVLAALAEVGCPVRVVGLVAAAENAIGGSAMRPGDVIRHYGGRTTEVTNTDAEGRLVLADAMAFAVAELNPDVLVDVATLTGAMKVALGQRVGGFFANDDALADAVREAGRVAGEPLWRFPLHEDYEDKLTSKVADADNSAGGPGAITAALFLQHFAGDLPWVHLDLASVGDSPSDSFEWSEGPTGFGARALLQWLSQDSPLDTIVSKGRR
jgi:leucyl aminopeptidase